MKYSILLLELTLSVYRTGRDSLTDGRTQPFIVKDEEIKIKTDMNGRLLDFR